jgi:oligosaccharyltransferase complex subunit alpha (ribophorin I)
MTSQNVLPSTFKPPQVFKNTNLVHIINLEKGYPKETINLVIENIASTPQDEYFIPFTAEQMEQVAILEVKDKKNPESGTFKVESVAIEAERYFLRPLKCSNANSKESHTVLQSPSSNAPTTKGATNPQYNICTPLGLVTTSCEH